MNRKTRLWALIGALALLAACTSSNAQRGATNTYVYECGAAYRFTARIEGESARLVLPDTTVVLPHVRSASGARYSDGETTFWSKGDEALLKTSEVRYRGCQSNPRKAVWEEARRRGVDVRAVGQESGWHLGIREGERITLVTDYGQTRAITPAPAPEIDQQAGRTTYRAETEAHTLVVVLEEKPCRDAMSGEQFELTATVRLDGTTYRGCGRALR